MATKERRRIRRIAVRSAQGIAAFLLLATVVIGFAHTRTGRPLLRYLSFLGFKKGSCPFGYDRPVTAASRAAAHRHFSAVHRGAVAAKARPALGFRLDATTRADVLAWAKSHGVHCAPRRPIDLACQAVPADALPGGGDLAMRDLWFTFEKDHLISIIAVRKSTSAGAVASAFNRIENNVTDRAGVPTQRRGEPDAAWLASGLLHQASIEYRFNNYYALARATNMGDGVLLTAEFDSLD